MPQQFKAQSHPFGTSFVTHVAAMLRMKRVFPAAIHPVGNQFPLEA
jgi:hypothetical protein